MRKNYFLWILLTFLTSLVTINAQTYKLKNLTKEQFTSGGTDEWSFERHDVNAGTYSVFTICDENSYAVNFYDQYLTERFNLYPIMSRPASGVQYETKRLAWYTDATQSDVNNEFVYVAHEYDKGTTVGNLAYGTSYPDTLSGYEVYSNSRGINAAITFTAPSNGYYRADMKVVRQDLWNAVGAMTVYQFFRYGGEGTGYAMGQDFIYGISQGIDPWASGNESIYNQYLALIPETPSVNGNSGKPFRGLPTGSKASYFYFYAKAGDKISFETDARSTGNGENGARGGYARTKWIDLTVTTTEENTAKADPTFVNPYLDDPKLIDSLYTILEEAAEVISDDRYSKASRDILEALILDTYQRLDDEVVTSMEIPSLITKIEKAIEVCYASVGGLKVHYTFENVSENTVPDISGQDNDGTLLNNASIKTLGSFKVLDLGSDNGYLDMGTKIGSAISTMSDYTISAYYRIDSNAPYSGNGFMLFAFSTLQACGQNAGEYIFYRMPSQSMSISSAGWGNSKSLTADTGAKKGEWQHIVIQQEGEICTIYVNGVVVKKGELIKPSDAYTMGTSFNWIGRPPFAGDNYLKQTLVYDFRVYNYAVPAEMISEWVEVVTDLEEATNHSDNGDYTILDSLITEYTSIANNAVIGTSAGQYTQEALDTFKAAISKAQNISTEHTSSQLKIDAEIEVLKTACTTFLGSVSFDTNTLAEDEYLITINDSLYFTNPGVATLANGQALTIANGGLSSTRVTSNLTQVWNISSVTSLDPARYSVFSALNEDGVYRHITENPVIQASWGNSGGGTTNSDDNWRTFNILYNGKAYAVQSAGSSANKGYWTYDANNKKLVSGGTTAAFIFGFKKFDGSGIDGIYDNGTKVYSIGNAIQIITEEPASISVYSTTGLLVAKTTVYDMQTIPVQSGLYIVKIQGDSNIVAKVLVK